MVTLKDIAKEAEVSISAVSKALNNSTDINLDTKKSILEIAEKKGYTKKTKQPSFSVGNKYKRKQTVAVIYSDITSHYYPMLLKEFGIRLDQMDTIMLMSSAYFNLNKIIELCDFYTKSGMVDGIIIISPFNIMGEVPSFDIPMVGISYPSSEYHQFDYICVDDEIGIYDAIRKLKKLGHQDFAYFGDKYTWYRKEYFIKAMKSLKLIPNSKWILENNSRYEKAGQELMTDLLKEKELPTAIFCAYDDIAAGAYHVIHERNFRVPEDFSLAGVDGTERLISENKKIASVNCHIKEQVDITLNLLFRKMNNNISYSTVQNINLKTRFVSTNSIGVPRKNKTII